MAVTLAAPAAMEKFVIDGGVPLSGTIAPAGNKNAALPILAACVLTEDEVVLHNVPQIRDVEAMLELLEGMGVRVERREDHSIALCARGVDEDPIVDKGVAERIRASFLLAGPLLARFGRAVMPPPGGDVIGRRRLDPHLDAFVRARRDLRARPRHRPAGARRRAARRRRLHGRAVRHGDRERAAWPPR